MWTCETERPSSTRGLHPPQRMQRAAEDVTAYVPNPAPTASANYVFHVIVAIAITDTACEQLNEQSTSTVRREPLPRGVCLRGARDWPYTPRPLSRRISRCCIRATHTHVGPMDEWGLSGTYRASDYRSACPVGLCSSLTSAIHHVPKLLRCMPRAVKAPRGATQTHVGHERHRSDSSPDTPRDRSHGPGTAS